MDRESCRDAFVQKVIFEHPHYLLNYFDRLCVYRSDQKQAGVELRHGQCIVDYTFLMRRTQHDRVNCIESIVNLRRNGVWACYPFDLCQALQHSIGGLEDG